METNYAKQASVFLQKTGVSFGCEFLRNGKHFEDGEKRDIYEITLTRGSRALSFNFGQSIVCSGAYIVYPTHPPYRAYKTNVRPKSGEFKKNEQFKAPSAYDVLACLTKYDPGDFENFCADYGYDTDSRKAEKVYKGVVNEWHNVCMLWNGKELEQLQEID